jgi:quaternary ammonium compound-resistance protein SugE
MVRGVIMDWFMLVIAGILEVCWSIGLKYTNGFTNLVPSILTILAIVVSMVLLAKAAQTIPIGTAYPIWVGIGALGAAIGGVILFKEEVSAMRIVFLTMLITSIIGLKMFSR